MPFFSERLRDDHDLGRFRCGHRVLDEWIRDHARNADRSGTSRTYVWTDDIGEVVAYFALAPHVVQRVDMPRKVGRGSPEAIPSILLARLALAESLHGQGWGAVLLVDALSVAVEAVKRTGGRLIVVDAIDDDAAEFYEHHGFFAVPGDRRRLVMKASGAAATLGVQWP